jgi:hydroxyacyl-ACP dehydratase HTD2-like protein with hotdog domain
VSAPAPVTLDQVREGQQLPPLSVDVSTTTVVLGALASRDWRPMHHDFKFATERNGMQNVFLSTPNQAAWFERYLTDWSGPRGRLGRMRFRMKDSVFADETMVMEGVVRSVETDDTGCGWCEVDVTMRVGDRLSTQCTARIAIPTTPDDNPWDRRAERWAP